MATINSVKEFENVFKSTFGGVLPNTLSNQKHGLVRFELGGQGNDEERIGQARKRCSQFLRFCFLNKTLWLRIILWTNKERENIAQAGFELEHNSKIFSNVEKFETLYIHIKKFSSKKLAPLVNAIINYDMGEEPSANVTCFFITFNCPIIVNIYDDRGLDIYSTDKNLLKAIKEKFGSWISVN